LFIRRPVMTTLVMSATMLFGLLAYRDLPVSDLPTVDYPTISVNASLAGASPETMASAVATPLEKAFSTISGLDVMTSSSTQGSTSVTLQFTLDRNIDAAAQDVQAAISKTVRGLPDGIVPPSYQKSDPSASPILFLNLVSPTLPLQQLDEYAETVLAQRIATVDGVAQVQVFGAAKYAVRIQLDPRALAVRKIGIDQLTRVIAANNVNLPTGVLWGTDQAYSVQANGQLTDAAGFRSLIISYRDGAPVRLGDVALVIDGIQDPRGASWYNGVRSIGLAVVRQPGTNTVAVARGVQAALDELRSQLPASVEVKTLYDRSISIRDSVRDVKGTLGLTLVLVVLVIFLFLRNLPATVIPSLALPLSLVGTFAAMKVLGYSLDNLSLMALTLAVGFVVDDAIVMLENIVRHVERGEQPLQAALAGSREIGFTILSMTVSLVAVFIPLIFLGGLIGRLFREFAMTISLAILISGVVSLTLTPMLCARFLRPRTDAKHGRFYEATERVYQGVLGSYTTSLTWVMRRRRLALAFTGLILVGTVGLAWVVPKGFIPSEDTGRLSGTTETAEGTSYESMRRHQEQIAAILAADSNVQAYTSSVGSGGRGTANQGRIMASLKPRKERRLSADEIIQELARKFAAVPGIRVYMSNPPALNIGGRSSKSQYQFTLQSADIEQLYHSAADLETKLREIPILQDVTSDLQIRNPAVDVAIDREQAAALGVSVQQIQTALYDAYGGRQVSTIFTPSNQYWVVMEMQPQYQRDLSALNLLSVSAASGELVPLTSLARVSPTTGPLAVNHSGQQPSVTLSFNLRPGVALGEAVARVDRVARTSLPDGVTTRFAGTAQVFQQAQKGLLALLVLAILVIYIVLGILYESFIHPLTILSGLPFAGFGALLALVIFRQDLSIYAFVGVIMLVGLVKKNAIMMVDFAVSAERDHSLSPEAAIVQACSVRFRPIMMTTMAALMGTLPIALGTGSGAESRRPLGIAVVGGLAFSQLITLYVTPVVYTYLDALRRKADPLPVA
jgi:HAE1 family hydrophobic/amphiphilic exporter-1